MRRTLGNVAAFQAGWFACVVGAARGIPELGVGMVAAGAVLHLLLSRARRKSAVVLAAAAGLGLICEWALHAGAVTGYPPQAQWGEPVPLWMIALWVNFGTTLTDSLAWLQSRLVAAAMAGAVAGPLSYWGGERLGAIALHPEPAVWIVAIGLVWAVATPVLAAIAEAA